MSRHKLRQQGKDKTNSGISNLYQLYMEKVLNVLLWKKGYRFLSFFVYLLLFVALDVVMTQNKQRDYMQESYNSDYRRMCAEGDFVSAHIVKGELYDRYTRLLGKWRGGEWCEREALEAQERYHAATSYIFGQEIVSIYNHSDSHSYDAVIKLLVAIPSEGKPLAEGRYGNKMFYNNNASLESPLAIDHLVYQSWVRFYNDRCEQLFDLALANGNMALACRVSKLYKSEVITRYEADTIAGYDYNIAIISFDNSRLQDIENRLLLIDNR